MVLQALQLMHANLSTRYVLLYGPILHVYYSRCFVFLPKNINRKNEFIGEKDTQFIVITKAYISSIYLYINRCLDYYIYIYVCCGVFRTYIRIRKVFWILFFLFVKIKPIWLIEKMWGFVLQWIEYQILFS